MKYGILLIASLLTVALATILINKISEIFFRKIDIFTEELAQRLAKSLSGRYSIFILEVLFIGIVISMFFLIPKELPSFYDFIFYGLEYLLLLIILSVLILVGSTINLLITKYPRNLSIFAYLRLKINIKSQGFNRFTFVGEQLSSVIVLLAILSNILLIFVLVVFPEEYYFVMMITIPLGTAIWVYIPWRNDQAIRIRRMIAYIAVAIYCLWKGYEEFLLQVHPALNQSTEQNYIQYFLAFSVVLFGALERAFKEVKEFTKGDLY